LEVEFEWVENWVYWFDEVRSFDLTDDSSLDISLSLLSHSISFSSLLHLNELLSNLNKLNSQSFVDELLDERVLLQKDWVEKLLEVQRLSDIKENLLGILLGLQLNQGSLTVDWSLVSQSDLWVDLLS
jgi:hypothetical protein